MILWQHYILPEVHCIHSIMFDFIVSINLLNCLYNYMNNYLRSNISVFYSISIDFYYLIRDYYRFSFSLYLFSVFYFNSVIYSFNSCISYSKVSTVVVFWVYKDEFYFLINILIDTSIKLFVFLNQKISLIGFLISFDYSLNHLILSLILISFMYSPSIIKHYLLEFI